VVLAPLSDGARNSAQLVAPKSDEGGRRQGAGKTGVLLCVSASWRLGVKRRVPYSERMKQPESVYEENGARRGLVGFFDLLGYKSIAENNTIAELISVVRTIQKTIKESLEKLNATEEFLDQVLPPLENYSPINHVVFSDSILAYTGLSESDRERHAQAAVFNEFCSSLMSRLFWAGLPVRGAWAFGDYFVENEKATHGIYLAGAPIIEAYELSNCVDMSACVIAPSAEKVLAEMLILASPSELPIGYTRHRVPLKGGQKQEMFLLDHYRADLHYHPNHNITRQILMEKFGDHKKRITIEVLPKINNTLEFLEPSKSHERALASRAKPNNLPT
jgi:hypothetical protein